MQLGVILSAYEYCNLSASDHDSGLPRRGRRPHRLRHRVTSSAPPLAATAQLRSTLEQLFGRPVADLHRCRSRYSTSFPIDDLTVTFADGDRVGLVFKNLAWNALLPHARAIKPRFLYEPEREIEVYRRILAGRDLGTATFFGAVADARSGRWWLFLEKVPSVELWQVGDPEVWIAAARWLAAFHQRRDLQAAANKLPLLRYDANLYLRWLERARAVVGSKLQPVVDVYDGVVERLAALPAKFIHGEFYASNVLVDGTARICPVDWEMAAIGPGLLDLAALVCGWSDDVADAMITGYRQAAAASVDSHIDGAFAHALGCSRLHLCVQWLGWSPTWTPPPEHTRDWLGEALALVERLR